MSTKTVRAQDIQTNLARHVPETVHAVAQWALPKIAENYAAQEALIERKVGEAGEEARRLKAAARERGRVLRMWVILAGVVLAVAVVLLGLLVFWKHLEIGLFDPLVGASLIWGGGGGMVLVGTTILVLGIERRRRVTCDSIDRDLADTEARLRDVEGELEPDAVLRVGKVYWAFELVKHPNGRFIPVNLAATRRADTVQLVCLGASPAGERRRGSGGPRRKVRRRAFAVGGTRRACRARGVQVGPRELEGGRKRAASSHLAGRG